MEKQSPISDPARPEREAAQAAALRRYRAVATALLALFAAVFAATLAADAPGFWVRLLRAGAEAAIIGGLADWFAVTALFRRPLGLPIPHTAIVPRQKERVAGWLGAFVVDNFLASHALTREIRALDPVGRAAGWLSDRANAAWVADAAVRAAPHLIAAVDDADMRRLVSRAFQARLISLNYAAVLGAGLRAMVARGHHHGLVARLAPALRVLVARNEQAFHDAVERRLWYLPKRLDRLLARRLVAVIQEAVAEVSAPSAPNMQRLDAWLDRLADRLERGELFRERVNAAIEQALALPEMQAWLNSIWDGLRAAILDDAAAPDSAIRRTVADALVALGETMRTDPAVAGKLTAAIESVVRDQQLPWRARVARFISDEVRGWDTTAFTRRIELWAGTELQYVRINGTLLGFLIGVALFLVSTALAPA